MMKSIMDLQFQHCNKILNILLIYFLPKSFSENLTTVQPPQPDPFPFPMPRPERWQDLACHPGWNNYTSNKMLGDMATFCDKTDDKKKDCFKLCMLRELELIKAKFNGSRYKFTHIYDYAISPQSHALKPQSTLWYAFPDKGGLETFAKISKPFYDQCTYWLKISSEQHCTHKDWYRFYKCVDGTLGCGSAGGLFNS